MATSSDTGADVTPRGDAPGFVHVMSETTLLIPDWPGNNRLDSLTNLVLNHQVALLFFIPGVDETLRVNGSAEITIAPDVLQRWDVNGKHPRSALSVTVREAYVHCAKALIRSKLWTDEYRVERTALPSYAQMLKDQTRLPDSVEQMQAAIQQSYTERLY
jgi:PPOX class probable FMN-dependent enzyme